MVNIIAINKPKRFKYILFLIKICSTKSIIKGIKNIAIKPTIATTPHPSPFDKIFHLNSVYNIHPKIDKKDKQFKIVS